MSGRSDMGMSLTIATVGSVPSAGLTAKRVPAAACVVLNQGQGHGRVLDRREAADVSPPTRLPLSHEPAGLRTA